jgi:hypothetical protein
MAGIRTVRLSRCHFRPVLERLEDRCLLSGWSNFGHDAQHTGISDTASQPIDAIHWQTAMDLQPTGFFMHYGAPVITPANTIIVPVKTGAFGGFELAAFDGANGSALWTNASDYTLPPFSWMPPFGPALTPTNRLYMPGNGGTVYFIDNPDTPGATISGQLAFFGIANYNANPGAYNSSVMIDTPITADSAGNIYFGFQVIGPNPSNLSGGGIARIDSNGNGSWVLASTAANDSNITKVPLASAPAVSADGSTLYVSVNNDNNNFGYLLALDSTTLATKSEVRLKDPRFKNANDAAILDISTASPMVAPDGTVFYGIFGNPFNGSRGFLLHFSADLSTEYTPGAFGWDATPSVVPASMVPSYHGTSSFLIFSKYNNYVGDEVGSTGGDGVNRVAVLDPYASQRDTRNDGDPSLQVMKEVLTIAGPTPDFFFRNSQFPNAVREWCINDTVVDPATKSIFVNSEDGTMYRWDMTTNTFTQAVHLTPGVGEPYVPSEIGPDGTVFAINGGILFALGGLTNYTLTNTTSVNPVVYGQSVTFTVTLASTNGGPTPTGTVTFQDGSTVLNTATLVNGQASFTTSSLSGGNRFITAAYSGDPNYTAGSTELVESVLFQSTATLSSSANPSVYGQPVNLVATVSPVAPGTVTPTGSVTFTEGSKVLGTVQLVNGQARIRVSVFEVGSHSISITYSGDTNYASSTSSVLTQTVNPDPTTTTLTSSVNPSVSGQLVTFAANVFANHPGSGTPAGTVTFMDGSTVLASLTLSNGRAAFSTTRLSVGSHNLQVLYSGSVHYVASSSAVLVQVVNPSSSAVILVASNSAASGVSGSDRALAVASQAESPHTLLPGLNLQVIAAEVSSALPISSSAGSLALARTSGPSSLAALLAELDLFFANS